MSGIFISFIHSFAFITADFKNIILAIFVFFVLFCFVFLLISAVGALACWKFLYPGCKQKSFDLFLYSVNLLSLSLQIFFSPTLYFSFWNPIIWIFLLLLLLIKKKIFSIFKTSHLGKLFYLVFLFTIILFNSIHSIYPNYLDWSVLLVLKSY